MREKTEEEKEVFISIATSHHRMSREKEEEGSSPAATASPNQKEEGERENLSTAIIHHRFFMSELEFVDPATDE